MEGRGAVCCRNDGGIMEELWREEGMEEEKGRKKEKSHYRQKIKCGMGLRRTEMTLAQHQCYHISKCGISISCKKINQFFGSGRLALKTKCGIPDINAIKMKAALKLSD